MTILLRRICKKVIPLLIVAPSILAAILCFVMES
jgi:hypothetical protein